jgi:hypothetical protein
MTGGTPDHLAEIAEQRRRIWQARYRPLAVLSCTDPDKAQAGKAPLGKEWQKRARLDPPEVTRFNKAAAHAANTGILCDGLRPIDIDIDEPELAGQVRRLALDRLGETILRFRENSGRCCLVYRAAQGEPTKRSISGSLGKIEVLGRGQQFVAHGVHASGAKLEWSPEPPEDHPRDELPAVTEIQINEFLSEAAKLIEAGEPPKAERKANSQDGARFGNAPPTDILDVIAALAVIPNEQAANWEFWNSVGMATWLATGGSPHGFMAWSAWSSKHPNHDQDLCHQRWEHYPASPPDKTGAGKLYAMAARASPGWRRPTEQRAEPPPGWEDAHPPPESSMPDSEAPPRGPTHHALTLRHGWAATEPVPAGTIVKGLLHAGSLTLFYGPPKSGKSFLATDLFLAIASDKSEWMGHAIRRGGPVLYIACEGHTGFWKRLRAAAEHEGWDAITFPQNFILATGRPRLITFDSNIHAFVPHPDDVLAAVGQAKANGFPPIAAAVDTVFRSFGGGNVNASDHMNAYLAALSDVTDRGLALLAIHHEVKSGGTPAGSVTLTGGADTLVHIERLNGGKERQWCVEMAKDDAETEGRKFTLPVVEVGLDAEGQLAASCVVEDGGNPPQAEKNSKGPKLSDNEAIALRTLDRAMTAEAILATVEDDGSERSVVKAEGWRRWFYREGMPAADQDTRKRAFRRAADSLLKKGLVATRDDFVWPTNQRPHP